jgi:23S rRNA (cytidine1920-2'-O)/16S rRNA (cytidine1409-2'-O)-methyltransferase
VGKPVRLDLLLVRRGMAGSRARARAMITEGLVLVDGIVKIKVSTQVRTEQAIELVRPDPGWVGRGALKLLGALEDFDVEIEGKVCGDFGASTGGFTQVLLRRGAERVYAIDVGEKQLAWKLRNDSRVVVMEGVNIRYLENLPQALDLVVADLSFISLRHIFPPMIRLLATMGEAVVLVKPQFEVGRSMVGAGGKVRDEAARAEAISRMGEEAVRAGFELLAGVDCTVPGARAGNVEHFIHLIKPVLTGL